MALEPWQETQDTATTSEPFRSWDIYSEQKVAARYWPYGQRMVPGAWAYWVTLGMTSFLWLSPRF